MGTRARVLSEQPPPPLPAGNGFTGVPINKVHWVCDVVSHEELPTRLTRRIGPHHGHHLLRLAGTTQIKQATERIVVDRTRILPILTASRTRSPRLSLHPGATAKHVCAHRIWRTRKTIQAERLPNLNSRHIVITLSDLWGDRLTSWPDRKSMYD